MIYIFSFIKIVDLITWFEFFFLKHTLNAFYLSKYWAFTHLNFTNTRNTLLTYWTHFFMLLHMLKSWETYKEKKKDGNYEEKDSVTHKGTCRFFFPFAIVLITRGISRECHLKKSFYFYLLFFFLVFPFNLCHKR